MPGREGAADGSAPDSSPAVANGSAESAFRFLEGGRTRVPNTWRRIADLDTRGFSAWHGLDGDGRRLFAVEVTGGVAPAIGDWAPTVRVVSVRHLPEVDPGDGKVRAVVSMVCMRPEANGRFALLCDDVESALRASRNLDSVDVLRATLEAWVDDWRLSRLGHLSDEAALGLFSELHLLRALSARPDMSPERIVEGWTGPLGRRHDFEFDAASIECKGTTRSQWLIHVNGWEQLEPPDGLSLWLWVERLERTPTGENLRELVGALREQLGSAVAAFDAALGGLGATDEALAAKDGLRTRLLAGRVWRVGDAFPRLRRSNVPGEVGSRVPDLSYELDLSNTNGWLTSPDALDPFWASVSAAGAR